MESLEFEQLVDSIFSTACESLLKSSVDRNGVGTSQSLKEIEKYLETMSHLAAGLQKRFQIEVAETGKRRNSMLAIHQIPHDLLSDIIFIVIDAESDDPKKYCRQRNHLESVCTAWKSTIRSSAKLWTIISSGLPSRVNNRSLKHSRHHLLTCISNTKTSRARNEQFWRNIKPHAYRFATIQAHMLDALLPIIGNGLPHIRKLKLSGDGDGSIFEQSLVSPLTTPWPLLESLDLRGISIPWTSSPVINLLSLTLLHVGDLSFTVLVEILQNSPQLLNLEVSQVSMKASTVLPCDKISLLSLRSLSFFYLAVDVLNCLFGAINVSSLERFSLTYEPAPTDPELSSLPIWTVESAIEILQKRPALVLHPDVEVSNGGHGLRFHGPGGPTLSWLRSILENYPESAPQIKLECFSLDLDMLTRFFPSHLDRCDLRLQYHGSDQLTNIQQLCRRLPTGKFPFPSVSELKIYLENEEAAATYADLLQERYRALVDVKTLAKIQYVSPTILDVFDTRMSSLLEECTVERRPTAIWPTHTENSTEPDVDAYSNDHSSISTDTQDVEMPEE